MNHFDCSLFAWLHSQNAQVATSLLTTSRYQDVFAWLATACCSSLLQLVETTCIKSVDNLKHTCCAFLAVYAIDILYTFFRATVPI